MSAEFLSLKEAEKLTGKSRSTLRRYIASITKAENHADRELIQPNVEDVIRLHSENHPFSWMVNRDLLDRDFPKEASKKSNTIPSDETNHSNGLLDRTIAMLENELNEKNKQIASFQERQRETNILLKQTTDKLALLTEGQSRTSNSEKAPAVDQVDLEKGSHSTPSASDDTKPQTLWAMLNKPIFRRK